VGKINQSMQLSWFLVALPSETTVHIHNAIAYMDAYIAVAAIAEYKKTPIFRSVNKNRQLTESAMTRTDVLRMIKRRALAAGLSPTPPVATRFERPESRLISRTAEQSRTLRRSPLMNHHERQSCTIVPGMSSHLMRSSGSRFEQFCKDTNKKAKKKANFWVGYKRAIYGVFKISCVPIRLKT
jgi:hypothetical protein